MKRRASLLLMEQIIMLLVLALVAALCLRAFAWADTTSRDNRDRDMALLQLQSAAETLKSRGGVPENGQYQQYFDENWEQSREENAFLLQILPLKARDGLGCATLQMQRADGQILAELTVCWQEVTP